MSKSIVFLIRSLETGGAERQLVATALGLRRHGVDVKVVTFYPGGVLRSELERGGVPVADIGKRGRWDLLAFIVRLSRLLRSQHPTVIYSFLPVSNILSALLRPLLPDVRVVWGVRAAYMDLSRYDWLSRLAARVETMLAYRADRIVCNSEAGRVNGVRLGYPEDRMQVIPNGIDTKRFRFDPEGRRSARHEWSVADHEVLIGLVARLDPIKDHTLFLESAAELSDRYDHVRFVCVGAGEASYRQALLVRAHQLGISDRVIWAGARGDIHAVYSALDFACSTSCGEGFSNTIAEAMACERPCVVTDVGDSAWIVSDTGRVVEPRDPLALADAVGSLIDLGQQERSALSCAARQRIEGVFGVERMVESTRAVLELW